jgi:NAD(P)-dependent dehydrogenase (short-subunit alcohol dehydrogenase family)
MNDMTQARSIFITGAASGIGLETARLFASKGWRVGLNDRNALALAKVQEELGAPAESFVADVLDAEGLARAIATFSEGAHGKLDVLFNCAGILDMRTFADTPLEKLHAVMDVNVNGVVNGIHAALPFLRKATDSRIITMSSAASIYGLPEHAIYCASKFAVRGLTEGLNIELEAEGIWVCDIMVAYVKTPMVLAADHPSKTIELLGVNVTPQQVAETVDKAVNGKQVHWLVTEGDEQFATLFAQTAWEDRPALARQITGY